MGVSPVLAVAIGTTLLAAQGALAAAAVFQNATFNWTLSDMDTMLVYTPNTIGSASTGWNTSYTGSGFPSTAGDSVYGQGNSSHYTTLGGAYVDLSFYGTGIFYFGSTAAGNALRLTVDGENSNPTASNPLLAFSKLPLGYHQARLSLNSDTGNLSIDKINVQTQAQLESSSLDHSAVTEQLFLTGSNATGASNGLNSFFTFGGEWTQSWQIGGDENTQALYFPVLTGQVGNTFTATIPPQTSFFWLEGASQPTVSYYTVSLDPAPPGGAPANVTYSAQRQYANPVNYFMSPLDPTVNYTIYFSVAGIAGINGPIGIHSMTFYSALNGTRNATEPSTATGTVPTGSGAPATSSSGAASSGGGGGGGGKSNAGAIAGGVVGGLVVIAAIVGFVVWYMNRRHERKARHTRPFQPDNGEFVIDEEPDAAVKRPYLSPTPEPRADLPQMAQHGSSLGLMLHEQTPGTSTPGQSTPANGGQSTPLTTSAPITPAARAKAAAAALAAGRNRGLGLTQELDAGRVPDTIPPSYDPSWAGSTDYALSDGAGLSRYSQALSDTPEVESLAGPPADLPAGRVDEEQDGSVSMRATQGGDTDTALTATPPTGSASVLTSASDAPSSINTATPTPPQQQ